MAAKTITVTNMSKSFSDIINKVYYQGEIYNIQKGKNVVAQICPFNRKKTLTLGEFPKFLKTLPKFSSEELDEMEQAIKWTRQIKLTKKDLPEWE